MCIFIHDDTKFATRHYNDVTVTATASLITSLTIVCSTVYSSADRRKHQSSASLAFVWGIHRRPVNSPHKWPVTRKMSPFDDVIMVLMTFIYWSCIFNSLRPSDAYMRQQTNSLGYLLIYPPQIATVMKPMSFFCSMYSPISHAKSLGESQEWNMVFQRNTWYRLKAFYKMNELPHFWPHKVYSTLRSKQKYMI